MSVCTKCWCWSYVFSALGFFSYCLPALFGPSSSQPVCYFLSLLRVYIFVSLLHHRTNRETPWLACTSNFFYVACAVGFSYFIICKLCSSPHGFLCVLCVTVVLSYFFPTFLLHFKSVLSWVKAWLSPGLSGEHNEREDAKERRTMVVFMEKQKQRHQTSMYTDLQT